MQLLVVRHGIAEEPDIAYRRGVSDDNRELTKEGREKMQRAARGLKLKIEKIDLIFHSPLLRAQQTAEIIAAEYKAAQLELLKQLRPETDPADTISELAPLIGDFENIAIVGHQPHVSAFISYVLTARYGNFVNMKKGAVCCLQFPNRLREGQAILNWHVNNSFLRDLG